MTDRTQWIPIVAALLAGLGGGFFSARITPTNAVPGEPESCQIAVARIDSLERRLQAADRSSRRAEPQGVAKRPSIPDRDSAAYQPVDSDSEARLSSELRRLGSQMEELLAASLCRSPQALAQAEDEAKLESRDNAVAVEDVRRLVEDARSRGRWTDGDAAELRERLPLLTRRQQDEILAVLIPALQGELEVDSFPPF